MLMLTLTLTLRLTLTLVTLTKRDVTPPVSPFSCSVFGGWLVCQGLVAPVLSERALLVLVLEVWNACICSGHSGSYLCVADEGI